MDGRGGLMTAAAFFIGSRSAGAFSFRVSRHGIESKHPLFMRIVPHFCGHENA